MQGEILSYIIGLVGTIFFIINLFDRKRQKRRRELDVEEDRLTEKYRQRLELLEREVKELKESLQEALAQNKAFKEILLDRDPDTEKYRAEVKIHMQQVRATMEMVKQSSKKMNYLNKQLNTLESLIRTAIQGYESYLKTNKKE